MPLPERYKKAVPEIVRIWETEGTFNSQGKIWLAQCEVRHEIEGFPTEDGLEQISQALVLNLEDLDYLSIPEGHETNRYLRLIQRRLPAELGNLLHQGNTSRDVLDSATSLQILDSLDVVEEEFQELSSRILSLADSHKMTLQIARTHGQHAVPQTFGRKVLNWYEGNEESIKRIGRAREQIAYGKCSGEVGTNIFISPELEERALAKLGLKTEPAPTQVIPRYRHAEVVGLMAVNSVELANMATNIRTLARTEIGEVREPFDENSQQGSSAMPHKRNPELSERIVGLSRRVKSAAMEALDTVVIWDEGDMCNSSIERFTFYDAFGCLLYQARLADAVIGSLHVDVERMTVNVNLTHGAIYSSRLLNALLETKQLPRTEIYDLVKGLALKAMNEKTNLKQLAANNETIAQLLNPETIGELFEPDFYLKNINTAYKRLGLDI
ncbi:MAG: lyase family protein [Candidatus Daviesbacteria bacterium]